MAATEAPGVVAPHGENDAGTMPQPAADTATAGTVALARGNASILRADQSREAIEPGSLLGDGDVVETGRETVIGIDFAGQTGLAVGADSTLVVEHLAASNGLSGAPTVLSMPQGSAAFSGGRGKAEAVVLETPAGSLSIGQATGSLRTFPDGRIELVLLPQNEAPGGELFGRELPGGGLIVTNGAGQFVLDTVFVVFVFDYLTPPKVNDLVPLDEFLGSLAAPLAALEGIGFASLEQLVAGLLLEDGEEIDDDSGLQLAASDDPVEPSSPLALTPLRFNGLDIPQGWTAIRSVAANLPRTEITFIRPSAGVDGSGDGSGDGSIALLRPVLQSPLSSTSSRQMDSAVLVTASSSSRAESLLAPSFAAVSGSFSGQILSSQGGVSSGGGSGSAGGAIARRQLIGTPEDDVFRIAEYGSFPFIERIDGLEGFDTILGTDGDDVLDFSIREAPVLVSIERIDGGRGNDTIIGSAGEDVIHGGKGNDLLFGGGGSDVLDGGDGTDMLVGDVGDDILDGNDGDDRLDGGDGNDILIGNDGNDTLVGGAGDDIFVVRGKTDGTDRFDGGAGIDTIRGTEGDDVFHVLDRLANIVSIEFLDGGAGFDTILATDGDDVLDFSAPDAPSPISIERIDGGRGNDILIGSAGDDVIDGGAGHDTLFGGAGRDILTGGEGNDRLRGGAGNDVLTGGSGSDTFVFARGDGDNLVTDFSGRDLVRLEGFTLAEVSSAWNGFNSVVVAGAGDDRVSITLQGYSVTDPAFDPSFTFDPPQAVS